MWKYFSLSNLAAGLVAVMVGFTSSGVLVFQAATMLGASTAEISSWLLALGLSIGLSCIGLSFRYRMPILTGWSTAGAALLVTCLSGVSMPEAIGAFIFAAALTTLFGITGLLEKIMVHIPASLASAMLAGILLHFGMNVFVAMQQQLILVGSMLLTYILGKRFCPRYTILLVLCVGIIVAKVHGLFHVDKVHFAFSHPVWIKPVFTLSTLVSIGIPLFVVTMTSQNIPGIAVLNSAGYKVAVSPVISWTGFMNTLFAPFGSYSICLAALTAAICAGEESDQDASKRYRATIFAGCCWVVIGLCGATVVTLFAAFPSQLLTAVAGLALVSTIGQNLHTALGQDTHREAALITLLLSSSGMTLFGVGAAFWGLIAGLIVSLILHKPKVPALNELSAPLVSPK